MRETKKERNLKFIPARDGKPSYYVTEITLNYCRIRRFADYTKEEARVFLAKLRLAAREGAKRICRKGLTNLMYKLIFLT